ncbi:hypothetical protein ASZ78_003826 [Callipepla squamata]|uniref:Uncharacterized protein n=1 Tax=Callipepla squamata TaxID=9009 RepID=A0A226MFI5_CALSU|nr:hypothetical protein ASZ78_003826 [Callipepla squamata]
MKEVIFLLLQLLLRSESVEFHLPGELWTIDQGGEALTSDSGLTPSPAAMRGSVNARNPAVVLAHSEIQAAERSALQVLTSSSSDSTLAKKASNITTSIPANQSNGRSDGNSDLDKIRNLLSNVRKAPLQQEVTSNQDTDKENGSPKQSSQGTGITNIQRNAVSKPSGFEATRGKINFLLSIISQHIVQNVIFAVIKSNTFYLLQKLVRLHPYKTITNGCSRQPGNLLIRQSKALHLAYWILCSEVCRTEGKEYSNFHQPPNDYNHSFRKRTN